MKNCDIEGCVLPCFRTDKLTGKRYCGNHWYHNSTDIDKRSAYEKHLAKGKDKSAKSNNASKIRGLASSPVNKKMVEGDMVRRQLLILADKLFGNFIKNRDTFEGKILCPCCQHYFDIEQKDNNGNKVVQPLHFVVRSVYSLRFSEKNVFSGCCYCNLNQHKNPTGIEYINYRSFLVAKLGNEAVTEMEDEKYKINKMHLSDIQDIITKYTVK